MDPLSISASTMALMQVASTIYVTLSKLIVAFRNGDAKLSSLCNETSRLVKFLEAVDRTLKECGKGSLSLAFIDENLWQQSAISLDDCKMTLGDLETFIERIKSAGASSGFFRRAKVAVDLTMYGRDISSFQEKVHRSNLALQTMLSAITVSLSLRSNVGQDMIMHELRMLKLAINKSLQVSFRHSDDFLHFFEDPSTTQISENLRNLARTADIFHSNASTAATTVHGAGGTCWNLMSNPNMSVRGGPGLTADKKTQIDRYFKSMRGTTKRTMLARTPSTGAISIAPSPEYVLPLDEPNFDASETGDDEGDEEAEYEVLCINGLEAVAKDSMVIRDFAKAETILESAIQRQTGSSSEGTDYKKLQIQLALCYLFQNKWRLAEPLVTNIAKLKANIDTVVCDLLHALALAHLVNYSFDSSIYLCKQALSGKRRLTRIHGGADVASCNETLGLLAMIHEIKGDPMEAEALRRTIPEGFSYHHPLNEVDYIVKNPKLSRGVFGIEITLNSKPPHQPHTIRPTFASEIASKDQQEHHIEERIEEALYKHCRGTGRPFLNLRAKVDSYQRFEKDTDKEVVIHWVIPPISSAASASSEEFTSTNTHDSTSRDSGTVPTRIFTKRIARFLGTFRQRHNVSSDELSTCQIYGDENASTPLRRTWGNGLRSKSDPQVFKIKELRTRLHRKATRPVSEGGLPKDNLQWVSSWLRATTVGHAPHVSETYENRFSISSDVVSEVPELASQQVFEIGGAGRKKEYSDEIFFPQDTAENTTHRSNRILRSRSIASSVPSTTSSLLSNASSSSSINLSDTFTSSARSTFNFPSKCEPGFRRRLFSKTYGLALKIIQSIKQSSNIEKDEDFIRCHVSSVNQKNTIASRSRWFDIDEMSIDPLIIICSRTTSIRRVPPDIPIGVSQDASYRIPGVSLSTAIPSELDGTPVLRFPFRFPFEPSSPIMPSISAPKINRDQELGHASLPPVDAVPGCSEVMAFKQLTTFLSDVPPLESPSAAYSAIQTVRDTAGKTMAMVIYDFEGKDSQELSLAENEMIQIIRAAPQGWLVAKKDGRYGLVPATYVILNRDSEAPNTEGDQEQITVSNPEQMSYRHPQNLLIQASEVHSSNAIEAEGAGIPRPTEEAHIIDSATDTLEEIGIAASTHDPAPGSEMLDRFSWLSNESGIFTATESVFHTSTHHKPINLHDSRQSAETTSKSLSSRKPKDSLPGEVSFSLPSCTLPTDRST